MSIYVRYNMDRYCFHDGNNTDCEFDESDYNTDEDDEDDESLSSNPDDGGCGLDLD